MGRNCNGFSYRFLAGYVDDLHNRNSRQSDPQLFIRPQKTIYNLNRVGAAASLLGNDALRILLRCKQESGDWRRNRCGYVGDLLFRDHSRAARHRGNQTHGTGAAIDSQPGFIAA